MKTLIIGTTNPAKIAQIRDALSSLEIKVGGVLDKKMLPEVKEDGKTVQENARKKATAYAKALGSTVFSMDNALFLDGLKPEDQPGIHVRRIGGTLAVNDTELLEHGVKLVGSLGNRVKGHFEYGICIADPQGKIFETTIKTPRIFTDKPSEKIVPGYPLESIQIDEESGKYISEMTLGEQAEFWRKSIGEKLCKFVGESLQI
jgi:XTP/dITP diphosphohydrolase